MKHYTLSAKNAALASQVKARFSKKLIEYSDYRGDFSVVVDKEDMHALFADLRDDPKFSFKQMMDLTAVDHLQRNFPYRFELVYHFLSLEHLHRLRVKVRLVEPDVSLRSISDLWRAADWYERECYDMYGIVFENHPNLKRILMYDGFEGHPLRKDYPITREQPLLSLRDIPERYDYMTKK